MERIPTYRQLGAALREMAGAAQRFGDENRWRPHRDSDEAETWRNAGATRDPLDMALAEADIHAVLLVRSALAHADEVGRTISKQEPFLPLTVGRVVLEHALRALHLTDEDATPTQRVERRLDDLLYAITESDRRRKGAAKMADIDATRITGVEEALADVKSRAEALGLTFTTTSKGNRVSEKGRPTTMHLAEHYLGGEHPGVLEFLLRGHGGNIHGVETLLFASAVDDFDPHFGLNIPSPGLAAPPVLAFELLGLPPALDNAFRSVASRFNWPAAGKAWIKFEKERTRLIDVWTRAVNDVTDELDPTVRS